MSCREAGCDTARQPQVVACGLDNWGKAATVLGMAKRETVLHAQTHKGDVDELPVRVFCTLTDDKTSNAHRNSKAIALLVEHLHKKKLISNAEVDDLLLKVIDHL